MAAALTRLDWTAFTTPLTAQEVQRWKAAAKARGGWSDDSVSRIVVTVVLLVPLVLVFGLVGMGALAGGIAGMTSGDPGRVAGSALALGLGAVALACVPVLVWVCVKVLPNERRWERWMRLDWFARTNGMTFSPADPDPAYAGAIFHLGGSRRALDHFRPAEGRFFDLGNFQYVVSNGKSSTTITWGFLALHLERRLPNMLLDSTQNNTWGSTGLGALFSRDQVLSLEGDFDRFFTLYCPKQYERDALYVFTPDLMALCIDEAAPFDIEIVDDWMFVYSPRAFALEDPRLLGRLFRIIDVVGAKALRQTHRYRDDRAPAPFVANVVAQPGQRLRRRFPTAVLVALSVALGVPALFFAGIVVYALVAVPAP
jgi:hypothetical protein